MGKVEKTVGGIRVTRNVETNTDSGKSMIADAVISSFEKALDIAILGMKSLIIANGGAVLVILAFLGNLWSTDDSIAASVAHSLSVPLYLFVGGVISCLVTILLGYVTQIVFTEDWESPWGDRLRITAVAMAVISTACFSVGAILAVRAFSAV